MADALDHCHGDHHRGAIGRVVSQLHSGWLLGTQDCRIRHMQGRRQQGASNDVQPASDAGELEKQPADKRRPLIPLEWGAVVGAVITATASLLIYSFNQIRHIDERLDSLEQEARVLLDGQGAIRPSKESLQNYYHLEALADRVERLEEK
jgi:hypothetical protein